MLVMQWIKCDWLKKSFWSTSKFIKNRIVGYKVTLIHFLIVRKGQFDSENFGGSKWHPHPVVFESITWLDSSKYPNGSKYRHLAFRKSRPILVSNVMNLKGSFFWIKNVREAINATKTFWSTFCTFECGVKMAFQRTYKWIKTGLIAWSFDHVVKPTFDPLSI